MLHVIHVVMDEFDLIDWSRHGSDVSSTSVPVSWEPQVHSRTLDVWRHWPLWWWVWWAWLWNKYVGVISYTICISVPLFVSDIVEYLGHHQFFSDFDLIWCVGRTRQDMRTSVTSTRWKVIEFKSHWALEVAKIALF